MSTRDTPHDEIDRAASECREACKDSKIGDLMQHIHHGQWLEILTEPVKNRIAFIISTKLPSERAERLRRLRPFNFGKEWGKAYADLKKSYADQKKADAAREKAAAAREKTFSGSCFAWKKADAAWNKAYAARKKAAVSPTMLKLHAEVCGCPWGPRTDIFGKEK